MHYVLCRQRIYIHYLPNDFNYTLNLEVMHSSYENIVCCLSEQGELCFQHDLRRGKVIASLKNLVAGSKPEWIQLGFGDAANKLHCCEARSQPKELVTPCHYFFLLLFCFQDVSSSIYKPTHAWAAQ